MNAVGGAVFVDWELKKRIDQGAILADPPVEPDQIQPNSVDLRIGRIAYRIKASFLPVDNTVEDTLKNGLLVHTVDLSHGGVLEKDSIYLIPLVETLHLSNDVRGRINPKSSTGRLDLFCRAVCDYASAFDDIEQGYEGPVYLEVVSRSFMVRVHAGDRLSQLRLSDGDPVLSDEEVEEQISDGNIVLLDENRTTLPRSRITVRHGIHFGVNLRAVRDKTIGYFAKSNYDPIDISKKGAHASRAFWGRIHYRGSTDVILQPDVFYIFASSQFLSLGPDVCAEMLPYDAGMGELRSHYAGFFDSGFGWPSSHASRIVLEVRNHHVPYMLSHGQTLFRVYLMRNSARPRYLYGSEQRSSNYQGQGLRLAKQFRSSETEELLDLDRYISEKQITLFEN